MQHVTRRLLMILLVGVGASCAHLPLPIERPTASVEGVALGDISFTGVSGVLDLSIFNPNGFGVPLESVQWQLAIGAAEAVSGRFTLSQTIPAKGSAPVRAALSISARDVARVGGALAGGTRDYTIRGTLRFVSRAGSVDVAFEHTGELSSLAHR